MTGQGTGQIVTRSFTFDAGAAIRGQAKRSLMQGAWDYGLEVEVDEAKALLESTYRFRVTGAEAAVWAYLRAVREWGAQFDD